MALSSADFLGIRPLNHEMTKQVVQALAAVGITVHDHVIVGKNRHTSFKSQGLI
jgi:DNA repair protein RadC